MMKWLMVIFALIFTGCIQSSKKGFVIHPQLEKSKEYNTTTNEKISLPSTVAILPFYSKNKEATKIVTKTFYNFFSPLPYKDIEPYYVNKIVKKPISYNTDLKTIEKIAKKLGVDGVIYGDVINFDKLFLGLYSEVKVGAKLKFYSLKSKKVIWEFDDYSKKMSGGVSVTPIGIATTIALSAYNLRKIQLYRAAEDLFRDIPKIIPSPKVITQTIPLPTEIIHSGMQKKFFGIKDKFIVSIKAKPNLNIYVEFPNILTKLKLKEIKPGYYEGVYIIRPNDNGEGYLKFILEDKNGLYRSFYDVIAPIVIDTKKPSPPAITTIYGDEIKVIVKDKNNDDIKKYILEVLKNGKYIKYKESKNGIFRFDILNKTILIRARSVDRANNISNPSKVVELFLYKDKNIAKSKIYQNETIINEIVRITTNTTLDKLFIGKNGYLIVMPNVKLTFSKNAKVIIDGTLSLLNSKLIINNKEIIVNENLKIDNSIIKAKNGAFRLNKTATAYITNSRVDSKYFAFNLNDASYLYSKNTFFNTSKSANASILITGNSYAIIINCKFSKKPLFDIMSNSTKKIDVINSNIKILGEANVEN